MRLPRLCGYESPVTHRLFGDERAAGLFRFQADVLIAGDALAPRQPCRREYLDTVANREDPFPATIEFANDLDQLGVVPQILGRSATQDEQRAIVLNRDVVEGEVGFEAIAAPFDIGVPARLEIVHDEVEAAAGRSGDNRLPTLLLEAMNGVES